MEKKEKKELSDSNVLTLEGRKSPIHSFIIALFLIDNR